MVKLANELQPRKASSPMWVTESEMVNSTKEPHHAKASTPMWVTEFAFACEPCSISPPRLGPSTPCEWHSPDERRQAVSSRIPVSTSSAIPASNTVASLPSNWLSPTMTSTPVVLRVSSPQRFLSLICCLSSLPVVSGVTSRTMTSPLGCRAEIRCVAMADHDLQGGIFCRFMSVFCLFREASAFGTSLHCKSMT